jgi:hypothetical protein
MRSLRRGHRAILLTAILAATAVAVMLLIERTT